jgi:hypothetical protein
MADIYGNSYLTIAASAAPDSTFGCLVPRSIPPYQTFKVGLSQSAGKVEEIEVSVRQKLRQLGGLKWFVGKKISAGSEPILDTRAWVFQERILPRRVLHFYSDELVFECQSAIQHESGATRKQGQGIRDLTTNTNSKAISHKWRSYVTEYSSCNITFDRDRLPAFSGVAHMFHALNDSEYCAGMWKHSIVEDLQWHVETETPLYRMYDSSADANTLPTWSWASSSGRAAWFPDGGPLGITESWNEAHVGIVICPPAGINPFGQIEVGLMQASAFMLTATIKYHSPYKAEAIRGGNSAYMWPDYDFKKEGPYQVEDGSEVVLFLMAQKYIRAVEPENSMLVLRYVTTAGESLSGLDIYERVGYANCDAADPAFEWPKRAKTILIA